MRLYLLINHSITSTVQGLKMHHIDDWVYDVSEEVRLGGMYAGQLAGPIPRELVPLNVLVFNLLTMFPYHHSTPSRQC